MMYIKTVSWLAELAYWFCLWPCSQAPVLCNCLYKLQNHPLGNISFPQFFIQAMFWHFLMVQLFIRIITLGKVFCFLVSELYSKSCDWILLVLYYDIHLNCIVVNFLCWFLRLDYFSGKTKAYFWYILDKEDMEEMNIL